MFGAVKRSLLLSLVPRSLPLSFCDGLGALCCRSMLPCYPRSFLRTLAARMRRTHAHTSLTSTAPRSPRRSVSLPALP